MFIEEAAKTCESVRLLLKDLGVADQWLLVVWNKDQDIANADKVADSSMKPSETAKRLRILADQLEELARQKRIRPWNTKTTN